MQKRGIPLRKLNFRLRRAPILRASFLRPKYPEKETKATKKDADKDEMKAGKKTKNYSMEGGKVRIYISGIRHDSWYAKKS